MESEASEKAIKVKPNVKKTDKVKPAEDNKKVIAAKKAKKPKDDESESEAEAEAET